MHAVGVLYVPTKAMEKFRNLGVNKVLGVPVLASYILGFSLAFLVWWGLGLGFLERGLFVFHRI